MNEFTSFSSYPYQCSNHNCKTRIPHFPGAPCTVTLRESCLASTWPIFRFRNCSKRHSRTRSERAGEGRWKRSSAICTSHRQGSRFNGDFQVKSQHIIRHLTYNSTPTCSSLSFIPQFLCTFDSVQQQWAPNCGSLSFCNEVTFFFLLVDCCPQYHGAEVILIPLAFHSPFF